MPRQTNLDLDDNNNDVRPNPTKHPERQQHLIALMAEALVRVWQHEQEAGHEPR